MFTGSLSSFTSACQQLSNDMEIHSYPETPGFEFSNSGRRNGKKYFSISLIQTINLLKDIKTNINHFQTKTSYIEASWRHAFSHYITDPVVEALAGTQTLPLFVLINKILVTSNSLTSYQERVLPNLSVQVLDTAINFLNQHIPQPKSNIALSPLSKGINKIFYGAPGTGKSHTIDLLTNGSKRFITVFHPETQYSDFVGSLKPRMNGTSIAYEFRPGPFTKALIEAYKTPESQVFLVIEEINRAAAAAVFGELFQLLDRQNGESKYEIDVADPDMLDFINQELASTNSIQTIKIPGNLTIFATMNSSDQAVMPMDTAFKRRWSFAYIPIDFTTLGTTTTAFELTLKTGTYAVTWPQLAQSINQVLTSKQVPEDRLLGPYFLTNDELIDQAASLETLSSKLFVYLWDDVLRHHGRDAIFDQKICHSPFGEVMNQFKTGQPIFSDSLEEQLLQMGVTPKAEDSE